MNLLASARVITARAAVATALIVAASSSYAAKTQVFRCVDADGNVVFSDTGCGSTSESTSEKIKVVQSSGGLSAIKSDGLSTQEKGQLSKVESQAAQAASQSSGGDASSGGASAAPASSSPAPRRY